MAKSSQSEVITFKVDNALKEALEGVSNRSQFIRAAILSALDSSCPLCKGTGILTPQQREHWREFSRDHTLEKCNECDSWIISCEKDSKLNKKCGE
jgi:DnaJ-class molecular chaperone